MAKAAGGDGYSTTEHLLFLILDQLRALSWLQSKDGAKGRNRPEPVSPLADKRGHRIGDTTDQDPLEVIALLARFGPQPDEGSTADVDD